METIYLGFVVFLFLLAIFDLFVGVSNDAVNFLNSAIGAKVAKFKTVIIIAAIGVFVGASLSNGMMEIARHGIFRPDQFVFEEIMFILLAVMVTDIVLLDIFNSLGMPTSTTVSMVFELLGATFAISLVKIAADTTGTLSIASLMNTEKALSMIMAIFVSVAVAFIFGTIVQFLSRLLFSFNYTKNLTWKIGLFGGVSATAITYFMLIKGVKDLSFMNADLKQAIHDNTWMIIGCCFVGFTILMQLLHFLKVNVFKVIVLMGTFALATAFAGNDLVNFIGVPLAGFSAYSDYVANGASDPNAFYMGSLNGPATTPLVFLLVAGVVMVYSLMTSKKAANVVKTSVDLARQNVGDEMFGSSRMARSIVRSCTSVASFVVDYTPKSVKNWVNSRFNQDEMVLADGAAFDLVRASVNLVLAGLLIALGTSLKLPLSTTYVAFMVAMGSSLADRAWGRESAVFRITGVLSVIGGWFLTAGAAFTLCFFVVLAMHFGGVIAAIALVIVAVVLLIRSNIAYNKKKQNEKNDEVFQKLLVTKDTNEVRALLSQHIAESEAEVIDYAIDTYRRTTDGFVDINLRQLRKVESSLARERKAIKSLRRKHMIGLRKMDQVEAIEKNTWFHLGSTSCQQMIYCLSRLNDPCEEHVDNNFAPMSPDMVKEFLPMRDEVIAVFEEAKVLIANQRYDQVDAMRRRCEDVKDRLSAVRKQQMNRMHNVETNLSVSYVYLNMLQESQELTSALRHMLRAARNFNMTNSQN